jgi:hypothetical protein
MAKPAAAAQAPTSPAATIDAAEPEKLERATVARGRTIDVPDLTRKTVAGRDPETGKPVFKPAIKQYGPGQEVSLPPDEVKHLRETGYLIDPDKIAPEIGEGPNFTEQGSKTRAA